MLETLLDFLGTLDRSAAISLFWYTLLLEIPRYSLMFLTICVVEALPSRPARGTENLRVTVVVAGHNEAGSIRGCVDSLRAQTRRIDQIICVSDGSTDGMEEELRRLVEERLIDQYFVNRRRCGKSSSCNLAIRHSRGDIIINCDADCSFAPDAVERLLAPFADSRVGAVSGNIAVRNASDSVITAFQAIEYLISISLAKIGMDYFGLVSCVSGAFGAFRATALRSIGDMDIGPGEDFDLTCQLRKAGWTIRFAADAWCATDVPDTFLGLWRQRLRWERDTIRLRLRKHRDLLNPLKAYAMDDRLHQADFIVCTLLVTFLFPVYVIGLFTTFGADQGLFVLGAVVAMSMALDIVAFAAALLVTRRPLAGLWPYVACYGLFYAYVMRANRLYAFLDEWIFRSSYRDSYVPRQVSERAPWW